MDDEEDPNPALGNQLLLQVNVGGHSWLLLVLWSKQIQGKQYNSSSTASHGQDAVLLLQRTDSRQNFLSSPRKPKRAQTACCKHTNTCADTQSVLQSTNLRVQLEQWPKSNRKTKHGCVPPQLVLIFVPGDCGNLAYVILSLLTSCYQLWGF